MAKESFVYEINVHNMMVLKENCLSTRLLLEKKAENGFQSQEKFWLLFEVSKVIGC